MLDGGTGLRNLTGLLEGRPFRGTILIGHLHWDHTHGLPFFRAGDRDDSQVEVLIPEQPDPPETMARAISPPHFPVRLEELNGTWRVRGLQPGQHEIEGFSVLALDIPHKMSRTFGFRVSDGTHTIAYLSDHAPLTAGPGPDGLGEYHEAALSLCRDADLVIHDAQYTGDEFPARAHFGHAAIEYAVGLARECGSRALMLFHHDPERTDDELDRLVAAQRNGSIPIVAAAEGMVVDLPLT